MKHADYPVDILDDRGEIIASKPRRELDKLHDIYHAAHVILVTGTGEIVVSVIPQREELPNLYAGLLGTTMATIRRTDESAEEAARRGLAVELLLVDVELKKLREDMVTLSDGHRAKISGYMAVADRPDLYRDADIGELVVMDPESVDVAMTLHPDRFAPTFKAVWPSLRELIVRNS